MFNTIAGLFVSYIGVILIGYSIGYHLGANYRKPETPVVEPKLLSVPAKTVVLKRASHISHAEKMSAPYDVVIKKNTVYLSEMLAEDAKAYIRFETESYEDTDTITATLAVYDINEEKR